MMINDDKKRKHDNAIFGSSMNNKKQKEDEFYVDNKARKMLERMGYRGGGLGKNEQGIFAPIEVNVRPKYMGLGFDDYETSTSSVLQEFEEENKVLLPTEKDCVTKKQEESNNIVMPELQYNLNLIVELLEHEIQKLNKDLRNERVKVFGLRKEKEKLGEEAASKKKEIDRMDKIVNEVEYLYSNDYHQEVVNWFFGWQNLGSSEFLSNEQIGRNQSPFEEAIPKQDGGRANFDDVSMEMNNDMSLKEVVEFYAQDNDLLFKPKWGRMQDGQQIYGFGNISIVIDSLNEKVLALVDDRWCSVNLEQLVIMEKTCVGKRC